MTGRRRSQGEFYRIAGLCLKAERQSKGLTQRQLAALLGIRHTGVSYIERGYCKLSLEKLVQACELMGADPHAVLAEIIRLTTDVPRETSA